MPPYGVVPREVLAAEPGLDFLRGLIEGRHPAPPFTASTGIRLVQAEAGRVVFEGEATDGFLNPLGTVHGGWAAMILDSAMGCAVHATLEAGQGYTTVDMTIHCVRPVRPGPGRLRCEGVLVHRGATIATAEGRLLDAGGKLVAHGTETCLVFPAARAGGMRAVP